MDLMVSLKKVKVNIQIDKIVRCKGCGGQNYLIRLVGWYLLEIGLQGADNPVHDEAAGQAPLTPLSETFAFVIFLSFLVSTCLLHSF